MSDQIIIPGSWWLPNKPEIKFSGQLKYFPFGKINFELFRTSIDEIVQSIKQPNPPIINGVSSCGELYTLVNNRNINPEYFIKNSVPLVCDVGILIKGIHFKSEDEIKFSSLISQYLHLDEWTLGTNYFFDRGDNEIKISIMEPRIIKCDSNDFSLTISSPILDMKLKVPITVTSNSFIQIIANNEENLFTDFTIAMSDILLFLSLGVNSPMYPINIVGKTKIKNGDKGSLVDVQIFYNAGIENALFEEIPYENMLFSINDVRENFCERIVSWKEFQAKYSPVIRLLFSIFYNPNLYTEAVFLTLTQVLESYHRRKFPGLYQNEIDFKETKTQLIEAIPEGLSEDFRNSLKKRIGYANQHSQRKRFFELFSFVKSKGLLEHLEKRTYQNFINGVCDGRNWLIHYSKESEGQVKTDDELKEYSLKLFSLVEILFLIELGFENEFIGHKIDDNPVLSVINNL